jgi:hypothetical protein
MRLGADEFTCSSAGGELIFMRLGADDFTFTACLSAGGELIFMRFVGGHAFCMITARGRTRKADEKQIIRSKIAWQKVRKQSNARQRKQSAFVN